MNRQVKKNLFSRMPYLSVPPILIKEVKSSLLDCWQFISSALFFQELSGAAFPEVLNNKSSNIISNSFVDYKAEDNKEFVATVDEVNEISTETCERYKFQSDLIFKKFLIVFKAN